MAGDSDDPLAREARRQIIKATGQRRLRQHPVASGEQRVDHRIAGDMDARGITAFLEQRIGSCLRGSEIHVGDAGDDAAVHFFRPGMVNVTAAQTGLDMGDGDFAIISGEAGDHGGQSIAMDDDAVGLFGIERLAQFDDQLRRQPVQRLVRHHHVQVDVRHDAGDRQHLIQQAAMLRRHDDPRLDARLRPQRMDDREHLDRFGPCPEYQRYLHMRSFA